MKKILLLAIFLAGGLFLLNQPTQILGATSPTFIRNASTTNLSVSSQGSGCAQFSSTGALTSSGSACGGSGSQTPWTALIDGAGFALTNVGAVTATTFTGTSTATSTFTGGFNTLSLKSDTGIVASSLVSCDTIDTDSTGNFKCGTDSGGAGSQTPWTSAIDGGGFALSNAGAITGTTINATSTATSTFTGPINTGGLSTSNGLTITGGALRLNNSSFTSLTGTGLTNTAGVLTLNATGDWTGTFDGQEGAYYLDARNLTSFGTPFYTFFNATTTTALAEGSNLYWTNTRFDNRLSATTSLPSITTLTGLSSFGTANATTTAAGGVAGTGILSTGGVTSANLNVTNLTSALTLTGSSGAFAEYTGTSCTNQFVRSLSVLGAATCATVANTDLANSTISGVALGGTLGALTATDTTLTFSGTYDGSTARTVGINLATSNTWSGLQLFTNTATSTFRGGIKSNAGFDGIFGTLQSLSLGTGSATTTKLVSGATSTISHGIELATVGGSVNIGTTTPSNGRKLTVDGAIGGCSKTLVSGATITVNFNDCNTREIVLANSGATIALSGGKAGDHVSLILYQDATGNRTISSYGANTYFVSSNTSGPTATTSPGLTTKPGTCNIFTFLVGNGTSSLSYYAPFPSRCY